jgi:hypothetical protein
MATVLVHPEQNVAHHPRRIPRNWRFRKAIIPDLTHQEEVKKGQAYAICIARANRSNEKEISRGRGVVANTLKLPRNGAVGFIGWLGLVGMNAGH